MEPLYDKLSTEEDIRNGLLEITNTFRENSLSFKIEDRNKYYKYLSDLIDKIKKEFKDNYINTSNDDLVDDFFVVHLSNEITWCLNYLKQRKSPFVNSDALILYILHSSVGFPDETNVEYFLKMINYINSIETEAYVPQTVYLFIELIKTKVNTLDVLSKVIPEAKNATQIPTPVYDDHIEEFVLLSKDFLFGTEYTFEDIGKSWREYKNLLNRPEFNFASSHVKFDIDEQKLFYIKEIQKYDLCKAMKKDGNMITLIKTDNNCIYILMELIDSTLNCVYGLSLIHNDWDVRTIMQIPIDPNKKFELLV